MNQLQFSFILEKHGWARAAFTLGDSHKEFACAYGRDPLGPLARLACRLAKGVGIMRYEAVFDCEGAGDYIAIFKHRDPTQFELLHSTEEAGTGRGRECRAVMSGEIDSLAFAACVGSVLHEIVRGHGVVGYWREWQLWSFPLREYLQLRVLLDKSVLVDRLLASAPTGAFELELQLLFSEPNWSPVRLRESMTDLDLPYDL